MKKLYRSDINKIVAGVCGGISEFFKIDPVVVRIITVILFFITGFVPVLFTYLIACIILPVNINPNVNEVIIKRNFYRSKENQIIAGVCGGLGEIYDIDANLLRLIVVFLTIITGFVPVVIAYIIAIFIIPIKF